MLLIFAAAAILLIVLSNVLFWPRVRPLAEVSGSLFGALSVLVPARDEAGNIGPCLERILKNRAAAEVLVYDDHSSDGTAALVRAIAGRDSRVRLIETQPLPAGWCGKNFACAQLAREARGEWMLFLDADARVTDGAFAGMLAAARDRKLTLLSCWPGFDLGGFAERMLMPQLNFVVFTIFPAVLSLARGNESLGLAHGACMLMNRAGYERVGGHAAVRGEIFEDTRLAQLWRSRGERALCLDGQGVVRVRMYGSFGEIWRGFRKNFFPAFRHEWMFFAFLLFHFAVFLLPLLLRNRTAVALLLLSRLCLALRFGQPWWSVAGFPVAEALMLMLGVSSWWHCRSGRGVAWKGRLYRARRV